MKQIAFLFYLLVSVSVYAIDPSIYIFPDGNPPGNNIDEKVYSKTVSSMNEFFRSNLIQKDQNSFESYYLKFKGEFKGVVDRNKDTVIAVYAQRRIIVLDWLAEKKNTDQTICELKKLSEKLEDENAKNLNTAFEATILARSSRVKEAGVLFQSIDPSKTDSYPFFAFEIIKYYAGYAGEMQPGIDSPEAGQYVKADYERRLEFADFLEHCYIPQMTGYINNANDFQVMDIQNVYLGLSITCKKATIELSEMKYIDLSERLTNNILPLLLENWKKSLASASRLSNSEQVLTDNLSGIDYYEKEIIPNLIKQQEQKVFVEVFGENMAEAEDIVDREITPVHKEDKKNKLAVYLPSIKTALNEKSPYLYDVNSNSAIGSSTKNEEGVRKLLRSNQGFLWDNGVVVSDSRAITPFQKGLKIAFSDSDYGKCLSIPDKKTPYKFYYQAEECKCLVVIHEILDKGIVVSREMAKN